MNLESLQLIRNGTELKDCKNENDLCYFKRNIIQKSACRLNINIAT